MLGATISNNRGPGIQWELGAGLTVSQANIAGNTGAGLNALAAAGAVIANGNWWGNASGPGGSGPGTGNPVLGNVTVTHFLAQQSALVGSVGASEILGDIGAQATQILALQNWQFPSDTITVQITDPLGWLEGPATRPLTLKNGEGGSMTLVFNIPNTAVPGDHEEVTATLTSSSDPKAQSQVAFNVTAQAPSANLAMTFVGPTAPVDTGSDITYTATLTNTGPSIAAGVLLSLPLDPGLELLNFSASQGTFAFDEVTLTVRLDLGSLAPGGSEKVALLVRVQGSSDLLMTWSATTTTLDPVLANNSVVVQTAVTPPSNPSGAAGPGANPAPASVDNAASPRVAPPPPTFGNLFLSLGSSAPAQSPDDPKRKLADSGAVRGNVGGDGVDDSDLIPEALDLSDHLVTLAARNYTLSQALNLSLRSNVVVFLEKHLWSNPELTRNQLANALATTAAHEIAHTLGAVDVAEMQTNMTNRSQTARRELRLGGSSGRDDIMAAGAVDAEGRLAFKKGLSRELLKMGMGADWTREDGAAAEAAYLGHIEVYGLDAFGVQSGGQVGGGTVQTKPVITGPYLVILDADGSLIRGLIDFGATPVDGPAGALRAQTLTLSNAGGADLTIKSVRLESASGAFTLVPLPSNTVLSPGSSSGVALSLSFDPTTSGLDEAVLTLETNAGAIARQIRLRGDGQSAGGDLRAEIGNNNLGGQTVAGGVKIATGALTLRNAGAASLTITRIVVSSEFSLGGLPASFGPGQPLVLAAGATITLDVGFDPDVIGLRPGDIQIDSNDADTPSYHQKLVGTGLANAGTAAQRMHDYVVMTTPFVGGSQELRTRANADGDWSLFLPADEPILFSIFDPASGLIASGAHITGRAGQTTKLPAQAFLASTAPDGDGDGLPDDIEFAVGTSTKRADTDADGIGDLEEIRLGLDPLGGFGLPIGVVGGVRLNGEAREVVVEPSIQDPTIQLAYIATGTGGLAVVDTTFPDNPIILSQLKLPGENNDVAYDANLKLAVIAAGSAGLHWVDVRKATQPALVKTLSMPGTASRLETYNGFAYVAVESSLIQVDLELGEITQTLDVTGSGVITDIARDGATLFTMDAGRTLRAVDITGGGMSSRGSLVLKDGGGLLSVSDGIAYIAASSNPLGGYSTVNIADPANLKLISDSKSTSNLAGKAVVYNRAGIALVGGNFGPTPVVDLFNAADPAQTAQFQTRFTLPSVPNNLILAAGRAFVADGASGLQIINFLPYDVRGQAPTVAITPSLPDLDPNTSGIQVQEGSVLPVDVEARDDVQIREVTLLLDGRPVETGIGYPYSFQPRLPKISAGVSTVTLQAIAKDLGGNTRVSAPVRLNLVKDTFAPALLIVDPADGSVRASGQNLITLSFSEALDPGAIDASNYSLIRDGDGAVLSPNNVALRGNGRRVELTFAGVPAGAYALAVQGPKIADLAGNALGAGVVTSRFTVVDASIAWINLNGGGWDDPANWNLNRLPGPDDTVVVSVPGKVTVTLHSVADVFTVKRLLSEERISIRDAKLTLTSASTLSGGVNLGSFETGTGNSLLNAAGGATLSGVSTWIDGKITGNATLVGTLVIAGDAFKSLGDPFTGSPGTLNNKGTVVHIATTFSGGLGFANGVFNNLPGGVYDFRSGGEMHYFSGTTAKFVNTGTLRRSGGSGRANLGVPFESAGGVVDVQAGELQFTNGTATQTQFRVRNGATLSVKFGSFTIGVGSSVSAAAGAIVLALGSAGGNAAWVVSGDYENAGKTVLTSDGSGGAGTMVINGTARTGSLEINGGSLGGTGSLLLAGDSSWIDGEIKGPLTITNRGVLTLSGTAAKNFSATLNNEGTIVQTNAATFYFRGATLNNRAGALFDLQGTSGLFSSGVNVFNNAGVLRKSVSAASIPFGPVFNNTGAVDVRTGELRFTGGGSSTDRALLAGPLGSLVFDGGTFTLSGATTFSGDGLVKLNSGTLAAAASGVTTFNLPGAGFQLLGGALNGAGAMLNASRFEWAAGSIGVLGGFVNNGQLSMTTTNVHSLAGSFINAGTAKHTGSGSVGFSAGTLTNQAGAVYEMQSTGGFFVSAGTGNSFINQGTIRKGVSTGRVDLNVPFTSTGLILVTAGDLGIRGAGAASNQSFQTNGTGRLVFDSPAFTISGADQFTGDGAVQVNSGTVTVAAGAQVVFALAGGGLQINGGTLVSNGSATSSGKLDWATGGLTVGATGSFTNAGVMTLSTTGAHLLTGAFTNSGTALHAGSGSLQFNNTTFTNLPGAFYEIQSTGGLFISSGASNSFVNQGSLRKTTNTGRADITVALAQTGLLEIAAGELWLRGGGTIADQTVQIATASGLIFDNGTTTLSGAVRFEGNGFVRVNGGTVTAAAASKTTFSLGTGGLQLFGGTLNGAGAIAANGKTEWTGTTLSVLGGFTNNGVMSVTGTSSRALGGSLNNAGAIIHSGSGPVAFTGAVLTNLVGATYEQQSTGGLFSSSGAGNLIVNQGAWKRTTSSGRVDINVAFNSTGTCAVDSGELWLRGGGTLTDQNLQIASQAALVVDNGTLAINGTVRIQGDGAFRLTGGTMATSAGSQLFFQLATGGSALIAGSLNGAGVAANTAKADWSGSSLSLAGGFTNSGALTISGTSSKSLSGVFNNQGTAQHTGSGAIALSSATVNNASSGVYDLQSTAAFFVSSGVGNVFLNAGTLRKSVGTGVVTLDVSVVNSGAISVVSGELRLHRGGSTTGGAWTVADPAKLTLDAGTFDWLGSANTFVGNLTNGATLNVGGVGAVGVLNITGNYTQTSVGQMNLELGGAGANQFDQVVVSGSATLAGVLNLPLTNGFKPALGQAFQLMTFGSHAGVFTSITGVNLGGGLTLKPAYTATDLTMKV
ncbi:MAG: choice-of-anchor D domain-containing protein [Verrucomicrobia bacterium]|nr:choice-of-anchor D domain-containing protein [Verrucomicrobiota bacterium]